MKYLKLKFLLMFFALAMAIPPAWAAEVTDVLNRAFTGVTGTSYTSWYGKTGTSGAVYAGNSAASNDAIQLRAKSGSAIVTTASAGKVKSISVTWNSNTSSGRILDIYCSNSAYTLTDFANGTTGTKVGSIEYGTSTSLAINTDYNYIAIKSNDGALYLDQIEIVWETGGSSLTPITTFSFPQDSYTVTMGESFTAPTLSVDPAGAASEVVYSSSNTNVATVDASTGAVTLVATGTTTITAEISNSETYNNATASYTLTVKPDPNVVAVLDFTNSNLWNPSLPIDNASITEGPVLYDDGTYEVTIAGNPGFYYFSNAHDLLLGKKDAYLQFPAFSKPVERIVIEGAPSNISASTKVTQNIFVGDDAVSTETTGAKGTVHTYEIDPGFQAAGNIYTLKVTNDNNTQFQKIFIYFKEPSSEPELTLTPEELTIGEAGGTLTVNGTNLGSDPGVFRIDEEDFSDQFEFSLQGLNGQTWFPRTDGAVTNGKVDVTYTGRELTAKGKIGVNSNNTGSGASSIVYYKPDIYIVGDFGDGWDFTDGSRLMSESGGIYTYELSVENANTFVVFARKVGEGVGFNTRYTFTPYSDGNWEMNADEKEGTLNFYGAQPIHFQYPGLYAIEIDASDNSFTITRTLPQVVKPKITPNGGNFPASQTVALSCETEGADIYYTTDNTVPSAENGTLYEDEITLTSTTTLKAIAVKEGMRPSEVATATFTKTGLDNLAAVIALGGSKNFTFAGEVVVTHVGTYGDNKLIGLRDLSQNKADGTGGGVFYNTPSNVDLKAGDILAPGWSGRTSKYGANWIQITNATNVTTNSTAEVMPFDRTGVELTANHQSEYIILRDVTIDTEAKTATWTDGSTTVTYSLFNRYDGVTYDDGKYEYMICLVSAYGQTPQVYPIELKKVQQVAMPTITPNGGEFTAAQEVTIATTTEGATLYYSLDGENWTEGSTLTVDHSGKVYAKATKANMQDSEVAEATFTINYPAITVTLEPETETYTVGDEAKVKVTVANTVGTATVTYMTGETAETANTPVTPEDGYITIPTDEAGTVVLKVTASDAYHAEPVTAIGTYTIEPKPYMMAEPTSLDFVTVIGNDPVSKTFTVMAENLKEDIALTMTESTVFTFTPATIAKADMTEEGVEVTVTYNPTAVTGDEFDKATVTIKSTDADDVKVYLTGMATLPDPELTVTPGTLEMGTDPTGTFTVTGQHLTENVTLTVTEGIADNFVITPATITPDEEGKVNQEITVTYKGTSTTDELATITVASGTAKKKVTVSARVLPTPVIEIDEGTLDLGTTGEGSFYLMATDLRGNITLSCENENFTVSPTTITPEEAEEGVTITVTYTGNNTVGETATINITTDGIDEPITKVVTAKAETYVNIAAPTFSPAAGTYTEPKEVAIACATPGVTIEYKIGNGEYQPYLKPFTVGNENGNSTVIVTAKASKGSKVVYNDSEVAEAKYTINALPAAQIDNKYYYLVNNALPEMYANVAGRRTLNFVADPADKAGTVFRVMTDPDTIGQVETLRSQGVDMQGYAKRAMNYVTPIVQMVVNKLNDMDGVDNATGTGSILGENGLGKILAEFNKSFDYHLYVEGNAGAYRIYARTPSMQRVVDFYNNPDNKSQIQEKLPMLEGYINQVLAKIRSKVPAGMNANVFEPFSLVKVWEKMGSKLIKPVKGENDDITAIMAFYDQVLSNKEYVWDFAYQTAKIYLDNIKGTQTYADLDPEYKLYIEKMEEIRPETKFFIIQNGNDLDYVREDHTYIQNNNDQTFWTLTERPYFTVNFPEENKYGSKLVTTLYTDFAYDVPEDVTAYKVTDIDANGFATIADLGKNVPAQTPVLLMTDATAKATTKNVTLNTTDGTRPNGNKLEGPDYLINKYKITSPTVEALFAIAAGIVGGEESDAYQTYVKPYEYLKLRTSGTVNNRYFWGLNSDDLKKCSEKNSEDKLDCVVRSLGVNDEGKDIGFYRNREALLANQAFIPNIEFNPILLEVVATPTFDPEAGTYNEAQTVTITCETEGATIYYKMGDEENWTKYDPEQPINVAQTKTIQAYAVKDGLGDSEIAEATYTIELPAEAPTFNPVPGSYEETQDVTIIAPEGATVSYRIDGGEWQTYKGEEIHVDATQTIEAKVVMEGMSESAVATGYYVIDIPEALPTNMPVFDGYYSILNSGKYANVQGRKTLTFTTEPDAQAGTVIRLKSDNTGKVEVLRSQAADLQRYAYRALDYVPDIVQIVVDKLGAEGEGHILGQEGLDAIMDKFDKSFKPDLYIEKAGENGYRIYGKTPSMQPVVDFYRENKDKVEAKLPNLVEFINSALAKLRNKANQAGMDGDNVFVDFDLQTIWERMGGTLTKPEDAESTMAFYREVLNYKDNVWNFAYQTATFYLEKIKNTGTYESLLDELGEYAQYLDKIDQIHPDFKYYIVANEGVTKPDFISEGNTDIANDAARTIWTIEPRENFTVNFPAENKLGDEYVTTLYTDFAYTLPEGVTAWAVESVNEYGIAKLAKVDGTTIAAQTPVLLKSTTADDVATFGITTAEGTVPATNELVGPDYLIETYQIKTPEVVKLFEAIKSVLGENIYNDLVEDYGHLQLRNSGTVNNKYFWGLNEEEVKSCAETNPETGKLVKVVRSLGIKDDILGFNDNEHVYTNKALLVSTEHSAITFSLRGDINRDGQITIADVPALIDILLELPAEPYHEPSELYPNYPKGLDYEAADFNENGDITIHDVSALIDYLLGV